MIVPSEDKKCRQDTGRKKVKIAIAQGIVAVLDGRDYVRLYENVWFVIATTFVLFEIKFALEQTTHVQRGSRGIDLLFL
jgi:hypothetical protein